ncbi:Reverse transcriptase domain-containing protein, partial [Aphis craccivora]
ISFNKFNVINDAEIIKAIKALKDNSSPGLDVISIKILKLNIYSLIKPLTHIYNLAIATSTFLELFKMSVKTPIHKKSDKSNMKNYCLISQISNISKAF